MASSIFAMPSFCGTHRPRASVLGVTAVLLGQNPPPVRTPRSVFGRLPYSGIFVCCGAGCGDNKLLQIQEILGLGSLVPSTTKVIFCR